ncbi:MAG: response regulator transcription factor [Pseudomonadota bacterium]
MGTHILIVEDDEKIGESIDHALSRSGHSPVRARNGEDAFFLATTQHFDIMVLDLGLPGRDGITVLNALRGLNKEMAVLILSARCSVEDRVAALRCGADDYLTKPFSMAELEARLEALMRRGRLDQTLKLTLADLSLDIATRRVTRAERPLELTTREYDLLETLLRRSRTVVSRDTLAREVWKEVNRATPLDNVIDVHLGRLRKKIDMPGLVRLIHTVRGVGFLLSDKEPE